MTVDPTQVLLFEWNRKRAGGLATSALPDAPLVPDRPAAPPLRGPRTRLAAWLRKVAVVVEPRGLGAGQNLGSSPMCSR